jgi:type IV secretory pathway VirB10-like protein
MHRMRVLSRRLKSWAFFFSMVTAIPLVFAVLTTISDGITERSLLLAAAALLCLIAAGVLWLAYGFAWAMVAEEAPREKETRPPLASLSEEKETRSPLLSLSLSAEKENRPLPPSPPEEKENRPPPPSPPAEKPKEKKEKEEEPIYTITGRRIN